MFRRFLLLTIFIALLAGCNMHQMYQPYVLHHPGSGVTVTCGHWVWWECAVFDYEKHGYQRVEEER